MVSKKKTLPSLCQNTTFETISASGPHSYSFNKDGTEILFHPIAKLIPSSTALITNAARTFKLRHSEDIYERPSEKLETAFDRFFEPTDQKPHYKTKEIFKLKLAVSKPTNREGVIKKN